MAWEVRNVFYERALAFVKAAVVVLAPLLTAERIPTAMREKTTIGEAGNWSASFIAKPMYDIFVTIHDARLLQR